MKLKVNQNKSAVDRPWRRKFLGFTFTVRRPNRCKVSESAIRKFKELDSWVRRRLRCYLLKQWGRRRYRELRRLGVSRDLAWNTTKSAHGPWRLSRSPALAYALPFKYFAKLGIPTLREWKAK